VSTIRLEKVSDELYHQRLDEGRALAWATRFCPLAGSPHRPHAAWSGRALNGARRSGPNGQLDEVALQAHVEHVPEVVRLDHRPVRHRRQRLLRAGQLLARLRVPPHHKVGRVRVGALAGRNVGVD
jgi:hypothetical protein